MEKNIILNIMLIDVFQSEVLHQDRHYSAEHN